jgi:hypothetical protein
VACQRSLTQQHGMPSTTIRQPAAGWRTTWREKMEKERREREKTYGGGGHIKLDKSTEARHRSVTIRRPELQMAHHSGREVLVEKGSSRCRSGTVDGDVTLLAGAYMDSPLLMQPIHVSLHTNLHILAFTVGRDLIDWRTWRSGAEVRVELIRPARSWW